MSIFNGTSGYSHGGWPPTALPSHGTAPREPTLLERIRKLMIAEGIGIYIVEMQDEHNSEYVAATDKRVGRISGFSGSAGTCIIGMDFAELATDSRYWIRAAKEIYPGWTVRKLVKSGGQDWQESVVTIAKEKKLRVGADPLFVPYSLVESLAKSGIKMVKVSRNLVDAIWEDKPALPAVPVISLPESITGQSYSSKIELIRGKLVEKSASAIVVYSLSEVAWLFNLRGGDVPYEPVFKAFAVITMDSIRLYCDLEKCKSVIHLYPDVQFKAYTELLSDLPGVLEKVDVNSTVNKEFTSRSWPTFTSFWTASSEKQLQRVSKRIWIPGGANWAIMDVADPKNNDIILDISPVNLARAVKNSTELYWAREAHRKCSISIVKYFVWLKDQVAKGTAPNEYDGGLKLKEIRETLPGFLGLGFETISAAGPNASSPHYSPDETGSAPITANQVYLLDSGSHFTGGTTDITRTVHFGTPRLEERKAYTCVFKGHIGVSKAVFPLGTSGFTLDVLARQHLWNQGWNYLHGSGHGVGAYLGVHELPMGIGMSSGPESILVPGHLTSIEPGYYQDGDFGVRIESEIICVKANPPNDFNGTTFLTFESITLVPYDRNLLILDMLTHDERQWLDNFNDKSRRILLPDLDEHEREWLLYHTAPVTEWSEQNAA